MIVKPPEWQGRARCATVTNPDVFFPDRNQSTVEAKWFCKSCPVQKECLQYAIDEKIEHGVWGGMSYRGRKRLAAPEPERVLVMASAAKLQRMLAHIRVAYVPPRSWSRSVVV